MKIGIAVPALFLLQSLLCPSGAFAVSCAAAAGFEDRIREAELAGDRERVAAICREWYASGQYSPGVLDWNYNMLMSVEPDAVLFTGGDSDTCPALLLQHALDVRPDVLVLNLQWLAQAPYRARVAQTRPFAEVPEGASLEVFLRSALARNAQPGKGAIPVYFGVMSDKNLLQADREKLYLTGLALKFSPQPFDNIALLRHNYETCFRTDYLDLPLGPEPQPETVAQLNLNYVPAFALLHRHYLASGEPGKAERVEALALRLARAGGRESEVRALFQTPGTTPFQSIIPVRALERPMKKIDTRLYAAETELTNAQYELFLQDVLKNREFDLLGRCRTAQTDWRALLPETARDLPDAVLYKFGHPDGPEMPVQNISHEAAEAYCTWITQVYNAAPGKKKFKKVLFRLPAENEWTLAASGGLPNEPYPWRGGYYVRNSKGCYLCNINATEPCGDCPDGQTVANDGGFFTVPAVSYYPNNFGLYNVSGNVAEMLREPGKTMGGSWQSDAFWCQIRNVQNQAAPGPGIGLRVFMEVIEE